MAAAAPRYPPARVPPGPRQVPAWDPLAGPPPPRENCMPLKCICLYGCLSLFLPNMPYLSSETSR